MSGVHSLPAWPATSMRGTGGRPGTCLWCITCLAGLPALCLAPGGGQVHVWGALPALLASNSMPAPVVHVWGELPA
jgi:hypothetical protein